MLIENKSHFQHNLFYTVFFQMSSLFQNYLELFLDLTIIITIADMTAISIGEGPFNNKGNITFNTIKAVKNREIKVLNPLIHQLLRIRLKPPTQIKGSNQCLCYKICLKSIKEG